ncbi:unnamed protein product, partial [Discosporangium mesarthrocarpum]
GGERPGIDAVKALLAEAGNGKLCIFKGQVGEAGMGMVDKLRGLVEGQGAPARAKKLLREASDGGLGEASDLGEARQVLQDLEAAPIGHPEEEALSLRIAALAWSQAASKGLAEGMTKEHMLELDAQVKASSALESEVEGFASCLRFNTRLSRLNRWCDKARKLLEEANQEVGNTCRQAGAGAG